MPNISYDRFIEKQSIKDNNKFLKEELKQYLKDIGCSSIKFKNQKGKQYLKVEMDAEPFMLHVQIQSIVKKYYPGCYLTSGGIGQWTFRLTS